MIQLICVYILFICMYSFSDSFPLQVITKHSLCYTVGPCWLSVLYVAMCMLIPNS